MGVWSLPPLCGCCGAVKVFLLVVLVSVLLTCHDVDSARVSLRMEMEELTSRLLRSMKGYWGCSVVIIAIHILR